MALKDIKVEDIFSALGFKAEDAEKVTLDDFKSHVDSNYLLRESAEKDESLRKKITGAMFGSITTKAASTFGIKHKDVDGKPIEDVFELAKTNYELQIQELKEKAEKGNDKKVEELTKQLSDNIAKLQLAENGLNEWKQKNEELTNNFNSQIKSFKLKNILSKGKESLLDKFTEEYAKNDLVKTGFEAHIANNYVFDIGDKDELLIKTKNGELVKSKKTVGHPATFEEIMLSEMEAKGVLKKNNATNTKNFPTFVKGNEDKPVIRKVHPNAQVAIEKANQG